MEQKRALAGFVERFAQILDSLDEMEMDETLEELNAQFEDTLFWMESMDETDGPEEIGEALDALEALAQEYRALAQERTALEQKRLELDMAVQLARRNLI